MTKPPTPRKTNQSIRQIAKNAIRGGAKSVKKDKRAGAGRSAKG